MAASNPAGYLPLNECGVITIFPMNSFCSVTNVRGTTGSSWTAEVTVTGGTPPYNVQWTSLNINQSGFGPFLVNTLSGGNYTAVVTDSFGDFTATTTCFVPIVNCTRKPPINPNLAYTCLRDGFGFLTGQATLQINPTGGTSPYVLSGNVNGVVTAITNNMVVSDNDVVTVFVRDYDGCFSTGATNTITIDCPPFVPFDICDTLSALTIDVSVEYTIETLTPNSPPNYVSYSVSWNVVGGLPSNANVLNVGFSIRNPIAPQSLLTNQNYNLVTLNPPFQPLNPHLGFLPISNTPINYVSTPPPSPLSYYSNCNSNPTFQLQVDLRFYIEIDGILCDYCGTVEFNEPFVCDFVNLFVTNTITDTLVETTPNLCAPTTPTSRSCETFTFDFQLTQQTGGGSNDIRNYILCLNLQTPQGYASLPIANFTYEILTATTTNGVITSPTFPISPTSFNFCIPSGFGIQTPFQIDFTGQPNQLATISLQILIINPRNCIYFEEFSVNIDGDGGSTINGNNGTYQSIPTSFIRFN